MVSEGEEKSTTKSTSDTEMSDEKAQGGSTTRHGSHLTKTSEGVSGSEDAEGKKA
jgi:hypothetical protein